MSSDPSSTTLFSDHGDPEPAPTARLHPLAILALFLGLLSALAWLGPRYWFFAGVGLLGCTLIAFRLNREQPARTGFGLAIFGLLFTVAMMTSTCTHYFFKTSQIERQAAIYGEKWLESIISHSTRKRAYMAYAATMNPDDRVATSQQESYYRNPKQGLEEYEAFVNKPLIRTLMALNGDAEIRFYGTSETTRHKEGQRITNVFAITYFDHSTNRKKTFFVELEILRTSNAFSTKGFWQINKYLGGVRPTI